MCIRDRPITAWRRACSHGTLRAVAIQLPAFAGKEKWQRSKSFFNQNSTMWEQLFISRIHRSDIFHQKYIKAIHKCKLRDTSTTLDQLRYRTLAAKVRNIREKVDLATLPPTGNAARYEYHLYRTINEVQTWLGNEPEPKQWGWRQGYCSQMESVTVTNPPVPQKLLELISCNCLKGCKNASSFRKAGTPFLLEHARVNQSSVAKIEL